MSDGQVILKSKDDREFAVSRAVANMSVTIKNILADFDDVSNPEIPVPNVSGPILEKVIQWCEHHKEDPVVLEERAEEKRTDDIAPWDQEFCQVDQSTLFELILAANFLDIKPLLDLTCKTVANMIKGKTPEEIRKTFNIKNDFTPEEEEQIRKENAWCEER